MKTIFIVNPCAGQGGAALLAETIRKRCGEAEIYITQREGDATEYVRNYIETKGTARFIACGGDGTFGEVLNGAIGTEAEIGIIPVGTGNDFCRNFEGASFYDGSLSVYGESVRCDAVKITVETETGSVVRYAANMVNIGFDCNVADMTARMKKKPFISGSVAYFLSIFAMLFLKRGANLEIITDGFVRHRGKLLLTSVANGSFCGGIKSNPLASVCDGKMDINIVKNISRCRFLSLLPSYMKGTHLARRNIGAIIWTGKCEEILVSPLDGSMRLCIDGEIMAAKRARFEIVPSAFRFSLPVQKEALVPMA